ncbi:MAG: porin family protein [Cyanobacteria bacterium CRU_2_1]|nr:porin family protein [Cyanobacteria bacterium RU_5_0]NJR63727.1 porin family protein [Cyanobacteria bacterium CRU_2_1]
MWNSGTRASLWGLALSSLAGVGLVLATPSSASAQAAYGSYIGAGATVGLTDGGTDSNTTAGGLIAVRYRFLEVPISLRTQVLISDATAIVPTISYDIPLNWQTDAYIGAGVAIQDSDENVSPIGNQTSFVLQPGIDYSFPYSNLVLFGNAIIAFDAYEESGDTAASVQGGLGVRF